MPSTEYGQGDTLSEQTEWIDNEADPSPEPYDLLVGKLPVPYQDGRTKLGGTSYRKYVFKQQVPGVRNDALVCDALGRHGRIKLVKRTDTQDWVVLVRPLEDDLIRAALFDEDGGDSVALL